jgi:hypothetical protein
MRHSAIPEGGGTIVAGQTQTPQASLAVWDIPATVVAGENFSIKAGASLPGGGLRGRRIEVRDAGGTVIAAAELGATPWPGTDALVWSELAVPAPAQHGVASLSVRLDGVDAAQSSSRFNVMVTPPPAHTVTIHVIIPETGKPLAGAEIRLGAYRAVTDADGEAKMRVAAGGYDLRVWKVGFDAPATHMEVGSDAIVRLEAVIVPEENADRAWRA